MQNNAFLEKMQSQSEAKLIEIVTTRRADYQPDAIAAAEFVLQQRNVSFDVPPPEIQQKKGQNRFLSFAKGFMGVFTVLFLVSFIGTKTGLKPGVISIISLGVLCSIWFFFGIMKGKK